MPVPHQSAVNKAVVPWGAGGGTHMFTLPGKLLGTSHHIAQDILLASQPWIERDVVCWDSRLLGDCRLLHLDIRN